MLKHQCLPCGAPRPEGETPAPLEAPQTPREAPAPVLGSGSHCETVASGQVLTTCVPTSERVSASDCFQEVIHRNVLRGGEEINDVQIIQGKYYKLKMET